MYLKGNGRNEGEHANEKNTWEKISDLYLSLTDIGKSIFYKFYEKE